MNKIKITAYGNDISSDQSTIQELLQPENKEVNETNEYFKNIDVSQFGGSSIINYFKEEKLVPQDISLSSRYICVLFEPQNGRHQFHILQRYTNAKVNSENYSAVIRSFHVYDPMDCGVTSSYSEGCAHIILTTNKRDEYGFQKLCFVKINYNNSIETKTLNITKIRCENALFASVSIDMQYFAVAMRFDTVSSFDKPNYPEEERECVRTSFKFVKIVDGELQVISRTQEMLYHDLGISAYCSATFIGTTGKAICAFLRNQLSIVDAETAALLSSVPIDGYANIELGYYLDTDQYFYMNKDKGTEYIIKFSNDEIELQYIKPVIKYEVEDKPFFCFKSVPYQYASKQMMSVYNSSNSSSFAVMQTAFELTMDDIKYSRSIILPRLKVIYAIRKSAPNDIISLDLANLDIKFVITVNIQNIASGIDTTTNFSQMVLNDICIHKSDIASGISTLQKLSGYVKERLGSLKLKGIQNVRDFDLAGNFLSLKMNSEYRVFHIIKKKQVAKLVAQNLTFSGEGTAFISNVSGYNYSYYQWDEKSEMFEMKVPLIKNVVVRAEFMPGSNSKVVIFDEYYNALMARDFSSNTVYTLFKNCNFGPRQYVVISDSLIAYQENRLIEGEKCSLMIFYNIINKCVEEEMTTTEPIYDIKLSLDKQYLYISTSKCLKVINAQDPSITIGSYSISNVRHIIEKEDRTYLICKHDSHTYQIYGCSTINPRLKAKAITSGSFLMKYITKNLQSELPSVRDQSIKAYMMFYQLGMVDANLGSKGETLLHYLIQHGKSNLIQTYFQVQEDNPLYQCSFSGQSPISYAHKNKKTQHMNIILEFFQQVPSKFIANGEDLLILMESPLQSAKLMVVHLFTQPTFYQCSLPYMMTSKKEVILIPIESLNIGNQQCQDITDAFQDSKGQEKVALTIATRFAFNFERGSVSSLEFLKNYSSQDSEEVVRSDLRLIVQYKFRQCLTFLRIQCALYFGLIILLLLKLVYFQKDITVTVLLAVFNTFFLVYELNQLYRFGFREYFDSIWNFTDLLGFLLLYVVNFDQLDTQLFEDYGVSSGLTFLAALTIFCLFLRGMSHLRIFGNLRYLINMIIEIIKDMATFLILLAYWILGFSLMFFMYIIKNLKEEDENVSSKTIAEAFQLQMGLTYRLSFGDADPSDYSVLEWIIYVMATFFIPLVLFNLIIAIMGDTYDRVQTSSRMVDLKEQANLVLEVEALLYWRRNINEDNNNKLLIVYDQELTEEMQESIAWEGKIKGIQKSLKQIDKKVVQVLSMKEEMMFAINDIRDQLAKKK